MTPDNGTRDDAGEQFAETVELYERLFREAGGVAVLADRNGVVHDANEHTLALAGLAREDVVGRSLWTVPWFADEGSRERLEGAFERALADQRAEAELEFAGADETVVVDVSFRRVAHAGESFVLLDGTEITEHRRRVRELERQNDRLDEFARIVSHDIRNPLIVAMGNLNLAREEVEREELDTAERSLDRVWELVDELLAVARKGRRIEERKELKLAIVANEAWAHVETAGATLEIESSDLVDADKARLMQLFENLFRNAVEHGSADADTAHADDRDLTVRVGVTDEGFYVEDDGQGLPTEREELFAPGFTTTAEGTGFGLSIVESIVLAHGWEIRATTGRDGGARFEILTS